MYNSIGNISVLDSILRAAGAEKYIDNFRSHEIEASALTLLSEEDLIILGLEEETVRKNLLNHCKNLQITTEKKIELQVDEEYVKLVLNQIYNQLNIHHANLACALVRENIAVLDVKLEKPNVCLQNCVKSFEHEIETFEKMVLLPTKKKKMRKIKLVLTATPAALVLIYVAYRYARQTKWMNY